MSEPARGLQATTRNAFAVLIFRIITYLSFGSSLLVILSFQA